LFVLGAVLGSALDQLHVRGGVTGLYLLAAPAIAGFEQALATRVEARVANLQTQIICSFPTIRIPRATCAVETRPPAKWR